MFNVHNIYLFGVEKNIINIFAVQYHYNYLFVIKLFLNCFKNLASRLKKNNICGYYWLPTKEHVFVSPPKRRLWYVGGGMEGIW